jgi:hypothetical protein
VSRQLGERVEETIPDLPRKCQKLPSSVVGEIDLLAIVPGPARDHIL